MQANIEIKNWCLLLQILALGLVAERLHGATSKDTLVIGYTPSVPFVIEESDQLSGISIWLWDELSDLVDGPYRWEERTFVGLLEGLSDGTIDFTINPLTINAERDRVMDFTYPIYTGYSGIAIRERGDFRKMMLMIKNLFSANFFRGLMILCTIILFFSSLTWFFERRGNPQDFRPGLRGLWDGIWWSVVTMTTVGYGDKTPRTRGGKMVALVWMFSGLLFVSGFTASIASSFTLQKLEDHKETLDEFKNKQIGTVRKSSTAGFLQRQFFKNVLLSDDLEDCFEALRLGEIEALFYDEAILQYHLSQTQGKSFELLPVRCNQQFQALGFSHSQDSLREVVSSRVLELIESLEWKMALNEHGLATPQ